MFQSFEDAARPEHGPKRLAALREWMQTHSFDAFLVPRADEHQGEYVADHDERLSWLTGFTGSAGFCSVTAVDAGVFIDGRYRVQVKSQVAACYTPVPWPDTKLADWLKSHLPDGGTVGYDARLHTQEELSKLETGLGPGFTLNAAAADPFDTIWADRPARPAAPVAPYPTEFAGESIEEKCSRIAALLKEADQDAAVLTLPDSIAWLLNLRGRDIDRIPVKQGFAVLHQNGHVDLYADIPNADEIAPHFGNKVTMQPRAQFDLALKALKGTIRIDPKTAPKAVFDTVTAKTDAADDPCILPKAKKNTNELAATRAAHLRDGAAMATHLAWLETETPKGTLTEIDVVKHLEACRAEDPALRDISFETIAGAGAHGAIVHYRVTTRTNATIVPGDLLLIDSGGQYLDGTTDITRTVATGPVTEEQKQCFTRVLQGMIDMSMLRWPKGLAGRDLDAVARVALWQAGQDYDHGTGHGVGVFLSVHEGPQRLSRASHVPLEPGMILSNEPGYYREGAFGIRIENLVAVQSAPALTGADKRDMLNFETLTYAPIDKRLIAPEFLTEAQSRWLDAYHADVYDKLHTLVDAPTRDWLATACAPL